MKKSLFFSLFLLLFLTLTFPVLGVSPNTKISPLPSVSLEATPAAKEATPASILEKVTEKKADITEVTPKITGKLAGYLSGKPIGPLSLTNFLQHAIRLAVKNGVPANTIVLILLFPVLALLIAASRHIIGIRGFGLFLPAVLSVVLVTTGIITGILMFLIILGVATASRLVLRYLKIQYLARVAILVWFICLGVFAGLFLSPYLGLKSLTALSIFPILILILFVQNFIDIQAGMSMKEAINMTIETLITALVCSLILNMEFLQKFVLLNPELVVVGVVILDIFVGKYVGLRILEYKKFKEITK